MLSRALGASWIVFALLGTGATTALGPAPGRFEFTEVHMGMRVRVALYAPDQLRAAAAARAAFADIAALDTALSDYRPDSELTRLSATSGRWVPVSDALFEVLATSLDIAARTGGAFDPTMGPLTRLWREARRTGRLPDETALAEARTCVGWGLVELDAARRAVRLSRPGMRLDLGGVAKGFVLQRAFTALDRAGTPSALIEAGGDVVVGDAPPGRAGWRIDAPYAGDAFVARASALVRAALATSGPTAQSVEIDGRRYSHVIDPRTGLGVTSDRIVGVIAPDGATADALSTALGARTPAEGRQILLGFPDVVGSEAADPATPVVAMFKYKLRPLSPPQSWRAPGQLSTTVTGDTARWAAASTRNRSPSADGL